MKKTLLRLGEVLCVVLLVGFIAFVSSEDKISTVPFKDVAKAVASACDLKELKKRDKLELKRKFSVDADDYTGFVYYSSETVMDVRELLIISSDNKDSLRAAKEILNKYVSEKAELFEGYAPKESELISSHVLTDKKGYLLFYIGGEKEKVLSAFTESL